MKKGIHPNYNKEASVRCLSCGSNYTFGSTIADVTVNICSNCHPFYTGQQVFVDSASKISSFEKKVNKAADMQKRIEEIKKQKNDRIKKRQKIIATSGTKTTTLKELLKKKK